MINMFLPQTVTISNNLRCDNEATQFQTNILLHNNVQSYPRKKKQLSPHHQSVETLTIKTQSYLRRTTTYLTSPSNHLEYVIYNI